MFKIGACLYDQGRLLLPQPRPLPVSTLTTQLVTPSSVSVTTVDIKYVECVRGSSALKG